MLVDAVERKRRTREHIIADLSVNHFERQALLSGHVVERIRHDYGYDLLLVMFDSGGAQQPGEVRIQLKASDSPSVLKDGTAITQRVSRADIALWLLERMPVLLVTYDVSSNTSYWLHIQEYFRQMTEFNVFSAPTTLTLHVPTTNVVNKDCMDTLFRLREQATAMRGNEHEEV